MIAAPPQIDIETLVKTKLPPLPKSVNKIATLLQDLNASPRMIADTIGYDPMLTTRVLRMANSPLYAGVRSVTTITQAVMSIGNDAIYQMVMMGAAADSFGAELRTSKLARENLEHSLTTSIVAREICMTLGMRASEEAFICGLLHDIGKVLLLRADIDFYTELHDNAHENELIFAEREAFGFDHAQLGAVAAHNWGLPEPVCEMILYHHEPSSGRQALFMSYVINVADGLAHLKHHELSVADGFEYLRVDSLDALRLNVEQLETIWTKVESGIKEIIKTFA